MDKMKNMKYVEAIKKRKHDLLKMSDTAACLRSMSRVSTGTMASNDKYDLCQDLMNLVVQSKIDQKEVTSKKASKTNLQKHELTRR